MSRVKTPAREPVAKPLVSSPAQPDTWFTPWRMLLVLAVLMAVTFPDVLFGGHVFAYRDTGIFNYPSAYYHRESVLNGEIPFWNPYNNCGIPFLAQWNVMALYPPALIYILLPAPWSITVFSLAHFFLAALGMYFLALRWTNNRFASSVAGLLFAWNGITLHSLMWPNSCASIGWMPWLLLFLEPGLKTGGRKLFLAALIGAVQMLAGVPEIILITWLLGGGLALVAFAEEKKARSKVILRGLLIGALVTGLTAAQMLPFLDLLQQSQRSTAFKTETWALPPWGWANFLVPLFRSSPDALGVYTQDEQQWSSSYYLGVATLVFGAFALGQAKNKRVMLLLIATLIGCLFALGKSGIVYDLVKKVVPIFGIMRYPAKWTQVAMFCLPLLAAFGVAALHRRASDSRTHQRLWVSAVLASVAIGIILSFSLRAPRPDEPWRVAWINGGVRIAFLIVAVLATLSFLKQSPLPPKIAGLALLAVLGLDVASHMPRQVPTVPINDYKPIEFHMSAVPKLGESRAMIIPAAQAYLRKESKSGMREDFRFKRESLHMNANLLDHVPKVNGLFSLYLKEEAQVQNEIYVGQQFSDGLGDFLGVSQLTSETESTKWEERPGGMSMISAGQKPSFVPEDESLAKLFFMRFDPRKVVYLPDAAKSAVTAQEHVKDTEVQTTQVGRNEVSARVKSSAATMVVMAQAYYHPWKAYVDGKETKIWRANHAYQAIEVPAGEHNVAFVYRDEKFRLGAMISIASLLVVIVGLLWTKRSSAPPV